jgi:hypothetical protein
MSVKLRVLQGGRAGKRRRGLLARLYTFWRTVVVRRVLLAITGWMLIEGGREGRPGRAA